MKVALFFLGLVALGSSAPQPRKDFHEHFDDFLAIITNEIGEQLEGLAAQYIENEGFVQATEYLISTDFKNLIYEMEELPEFKAVVDFLEKDNIDILYFIDIINEALESVPNRNRQASSESDVSDFINASIALFPKEQLAALFDQKMAEDEEFRTAIENLQSEEWQQIIDALLNSETFQKETQILLEHGIDLRVFLYEIIAIFGQN